MFYSNKQNNEEVVELIYSEQGVVIVIDQADTIKSNQPVGRIIKKGKKQFKKDFKKASERYIKMEPIDDERKQEVINTFITDKIGILKYTEDYIETNKKYDRLEEINKQTEAQRIRMMKTLADDYNPNGIVMKDIIKE